MLSHVKIPWKKLETILNEIVDQVNRQAPIQGNGIILAPQGESGIIISAEQTDADASPPNSSSSSSSSVGQ